MSELDLVVVIRDTSDSAAVHFMNFVTGLFAFVLASHFVGASLSRINVGILIGIFSAFSLISGFAAVTRLRAVTILLEQLAVLPDTKLGFSGFVAAPYAPHMIAVVLFVAYVGGIVFLFEARRAARSQPAPPAV